MTAGYSNGSIQLSAPATSSLSATGAVSISTNGSTISIGAPAAFTKSHYEPFAQAVAVAGQQGQATLHVHPVPGDAMNLQFDRVMFDVNWTNATNSTGSATISMWAGIYTRNASTLSLVGSASRSIGLTFSGTGGNQSLQAGGRQLSMGWTTTLTQNDYWMGIVYRTTSGGTDGSFSQYLISDINSGYSGEMGVASNNTAQNVLGLGHYTATTSGNPASIAFSQLNGASTNGSLVYRVPIYRFLSQSA